MFKKFELKLTAFARARPLLFSRTGLSNLLNKIQFTFEVVPCLILGDFFTGVRQFWPRVTRGWVGKRRGGAGRGGGGEGGGKSCQVKTRGHQSPLDGPDH